jgi:hypothetical protein
VAEQTTVRTLGGTRLLVFGKLVRLPKLSRPFVGDHAACLVLARTGGDDVAVREGFEPSVEV